MRAATVVQRVTCKSCRTCFKFYCMFYFTCDRSFSPAYKAGSLRTPRLPDTKPTCRPLPHECETHITSVYRCILATPLSGVDAGVCRVVAAYRTIGGTSVHGAASPRTKPRNAAEAISPSSWSWMYSRPFTGFSPPLRFQLYASR